MFARNEYGANFPIMKKVDVKGESVNDLWDFLQGTLSVLLVFMPQDL